MAFNNVLVISQISGHVMALVLSTCVIIPLLMHNSKFNNNCALFIDGQWSEEDGSFHIMSSKAVFCNYPIVTSIFVFLVSLVQIYRFSRLAYKKEETTFLGLFLDVCFSTIMFLMTIISAFFITLGFMSFCSEMTQRFSSCGLAAGQNITQGNIIDTSGFYVELGTAQFGIWGALAGCVMVCVVAYLKIIDDHQMQNMKASMYHQRLVHGETSSLADSLNSLPASPASTSTMDRGITQQTGRNPEA